MKIALDYDRCYTLNKVFWNTFISHGLMLGFDIRIVTARSPTKDNIDDRVKSGIPIIYCDGVAKRFVCHHFHDWDPDVWIDDKPQGVDNNSTATKEILEKWRASEEYND